MTTEALVSVIIPAHNRGDLLKRAIESVLAQEYHHFEIIVADDASEEDLSVVTNAFADRRIRLIRNAVKSHAGGARNLGLEHAQGEYVAFLDSDDEWLPDHLSSHIEAINKYDVDGVYGSVFIFDGEQRTYQGSKAIADNQHPADYVLSGGILPTPTWVMKSAAAKSLRFDAELIIHEDYDYFVRFAAQYRWYAMWQPTTIVHWQKGVIRKRNPYSEIKFVQRYYSNIAQRTYFMYHLSNLTDYRRLGASAHLLQYYRTEALRYVYAITFNDYCSLFPDRKGMSGFVFNYFGFVWRLLISKFTTQQPPMPLYPATK